MCEQARLGANIEVTADPLLMLSVFVTLYIGIAVLGMTLPQLGLLLFVLNRLNAKVKEFNAGRQAISLNMAGLAARQGADAGRRRLQHDPAGAGALRGSRARARAQPTSRSRIRTRAADGALGVRRASAVLNGISVTIPAGSFTALVGRSGTGKSTLVELLPRLRDATGGTITYDGTDIKAFDVGALRKGIGYLTQSAMLFNDTVRENLDVRARLRADGRADPRRSGARSRRRSSTTCRRGSRPCWAIEECGSPGESSSASRSRACCSRTRRS